MYNRFCYWFFPISCMMMQSLLFFNIIYVFYVYIFPSNIQILYQLFLIIENDLFFIVLVNDNNG